MIAGKKLCRQAHHQLQIFRSIKLISLDPPQRISNPIQSRNVMRFDLQSCRTTADGYYTAGQQIDLAYIQRRLFRHGFQAVIPGGRKTLQQSVVAGVQVDFFFCQAATGNQLAVRLGENQQAVVFFIFPDLVLPFEAGIIFNIYISRQLLTKRLETLLAVRSENFRLFITIVIADGYLPGCLFHGRQQNTVLQVPDNQLRNRGPENSRRGRAGLYGFSHPFFKNGQAIFIGRGVGQQVGENTGVVTAVVILDRFSGGFRKRIAQPGHQALLPQPDFFGVVFVRQPDAR